MNDLCFASFLAEFQLYFAYKRAHNTYFAQTFVIFLPPPYYNLHYVLGTYQAELRVKYEYEVENIRGKK